MEFGFMNLIFGMASIAIPALMIGYFVIYLGNRNKKPNEKSGTKVFTVVVLLMSFFFSWNTYGPRVKATGLNDTPSVQYSPERQEVETGKKFVDPGPKRLGQFDRRIDEEPVEEKDSDNDGDNN